MPNETNGRNIEKKGIGYQISFLLQSNGIFDTYQKRTHLNSIICNFVVISILLDRVFEIWDMLGSIHCIMLYCNYSLAEMSSTKRISLLMQNKLKNEK